MDWRDTDADIQNDARFCRVSLPYAWLLESRGASSRGSPERKTVVYFGNDFFATEGIDREAFTRRTNQCLDYVRAHGRGYRLIYRPHPDEKRELDVLDLTSFEIMRDGRTSEEFVLDNRDSIACTFSFCSTSSIASLNMGVRSYVFYKCLKDLFGEANNIYVDNYLDGLPEDFFIHSLAAPLPQQHSIVEKDPRVRDRLVEILAEREGDIWFTIQEDRYALLVESLVIIVRQLAPDRKIHIIVSKHHRWTEERIQRLRTLFDTVIVLPQVFYSLRPQKLLKAVRTAWQVWRIPIRKDALIFGIAHHDFIENCVVSYNRGPYTVAVLPESIWRLNFKPERLGLDEKRFVFDKAGLFYNVFFEPLLGLGRTRFMRYWRGARGTAYFISLQKPIEDVYDKVMLISNVPSA